MQKFLYSLILLDLGQICRLFRSFLGVFPTTSPLGSLSVMTP